MFQMSVVQRAWLTNVLVRKVHKKKKNLPWCPNQPRPNPVAHLIICQQHINVPRCTGSGSPQWRNHPVHQVYVGIMVLPRKPMYCKCEAAILSVSLLALEIASLEWRINVQTTLETLRAVRRRLWRSAEMTAALFNGSFSSGQANAVTWMPIERGVEISTCISMQNTG